MLCGRHGRRDDLRGGRTPDDYLYVGMNMHWDNHTFELPRLPDGLRWHIFANTAMAAPNDIHPPGQEPLLGDQTQLLIGGRAVVALVGRGESTR
jgi:glycogen operon protein